MLDENLVLGGFSSFKRWRVESFVSFVIALGVYLTKKVRFC